MNTWFATIEAVGWNDCIGWDDASIGNDNIFSDNRSMTNDAVLPNASEAAYLGCRDNGVLLDKDVVSDVHRHEFDSSIVLFVAGFKDHSLEQCDVLAQRYLR